MYPGLEKEAQVLTAPGRCFEGSSVALPSSIIPQVLQEGMVTNFDSASWIATSYPYAAIASGLTWSSGC